MFSVCFQWNSNMLFDPKISKLWFCQSSLSPLLQLCTLLVLLAKHHCYACVLIIQDRS